MGSEMQIPATKTNHEDDTDDSAALADGIREPKTSADNISETNALVDETDGSKVLIDDTKETKTLADDTGEATDKSNSLADGTSRVKALVDDNGETKAMTDSIGETKTPTYDIGEATNTVGETKSFADDKAEIDDASKDDSVLSPTSLYVSTFPTFGFTERTKKTDLTLIVGNKNVYVTRAVLELTSSKFQTLLEANEDKTEIELKDRDAREFVEFLACFYPGKGHKVTQENVFSMLPLATEYEIDHVINQCETCLQSLLSSNETPTELFLRIVRVVYDFHLDNLKQDCLNALESRSLDDIVKTTDQNVLPMEAKAEMFSSLVPKLIHDTHKYKYLHAGLSKKKAARLKKLKEVKYFTVRMDMQADVVGEQKGEITKEKERKWYLLISRYPSKGVLGTFNVTIHCEKDDGVILRDCQGFAMVLVRNHIPWKDNVLKEIEFELKSDCKNFTSQKVRIEDASVFQKEAGFLMNKQYVIEAHILLCETGDHKT